MLPMQFGKNEKIFFHKNKVVISHFCIQNNAYNQSSGLFETT